MTTTMRRLDPAASAERALRILPIAANLLPPEIAASRRARRTRRIVLLALIVFVALLMGWYVLASHETSTARSDLSRAEDAAQRLVRQQSAYSQVVAIQAESKAIGTQLAALLANDLQWSQLLSSLQKAAPAGVTLTGITSALESGTAAGTAGSTAGAAGGTAGTTAQLPNLSGGKSIGTVTVTGSSTTKAGVAAYVDALAKVRGVANPLLTDATEQQGHVDFTVGLNITKSALGGRYTPKKTSGASGGQ